MSHSFLETPTLSAIDIAHTAHSEGATLGWRLHYARAQPETVDLIAVVSGLVASLFAHFPGLNDVALLNVVEPEHDSTLEAFTNNRDVVLLTA